MVYAFVAAKLVLLVKRDGKSQRKKDGKKGSKFQAFFQKAEKDSGKEADKNRQRQKILQVWYGEDIKKAKPKAQKKEKENKDTAVFPKKNDKAKKAGDKKAGIDKPWPAYASAVDVN